MSNLALLFPGQGAQKVGMGSDLVETWSSAREVFDIANEETGLALDVLCFEGPLDELSRSDIAQPAILTVSIAALRALQEAGGPLPTAGAAGLSLGEYSALVAAGAIEFRQAVRLVRRRGLHMQKACDASPGAMYSVLGLEDAQVRQACGTARTRTGGGVWPANFNCPGQVVISGEEDPCRVAADLCSAMGARRALRLKVAGAFHTVLMKPAAEKLSLDLAEVEVTEPAFPVISNVTGLPVADPDEIRSTLVQQVTSPVRWHACQRWLLDEGVSRYLEVGPGKVLKGLLKRTDPDAECTTVNGAAHVQAYADEDSAS